MKTDLYLPERDASLSDTLDAVGQGGHSELQSSKDRVNRERFLGVHVIARQPVKDMREHLSTTFNIWEDCSSTTLPTAYTLLILRKARGRSVWKRSVQIPGSPWWYD